MTVNNPHSADADSRERDLRELALVDKIIGLEAEVARLSVEAGIKDIRILRNSRPWRLGHALLTPFAWVLRLSGRK